MAEGPPVKEVKTLRREGSSTIEEYERLNQDGTVTKIVTVTDPTTGMKHYDVYRMDKSGIVRKVNSADQESLAGLGEATDAKHEWFRRQAAESQNMPRPQELPKDMQPYLGKQFPFERYSPDGERIIQPQDEFLQLIRDAKAMSREEKIAVFNKYKEKLIDFGTKKLENVLKHKLSDSNNSKISTTPMTEEQKNNLVSYGVKKMQNLLLNDLSEELFFSEILPRYESEHVSPTFSPTTSQTQNQNPMDRPISFSLQPGPANSNEPKGRPISFTIRPEEIKNSQATYYEPKRDRSINTVESLNQSVSRLEKEIQDSIKYTKMSDNEKSLEQQKKEEVIKFALQGMKNTTKETEEERRRINEESYERRKNNPILQVVKQYSEQFQKQKEELQKKPTIQYKFSEPLVEQKQVKEQETKKKRSDPEIEPDTTAYAEIIEYMGEKLRSKPREEMTNKKYDKMINKMFDEEEVFAMGQKVLRKMLKKRHEEELRAKAEELISNGTEKQPRGCFEYLTKQKSKPDTNNHEKLYGDKQRQERSEIDSPKPKKKFDWNALLAPFQEYFSDEDNNEKTSNVDNKPQLNSNQSEAEEEQSFTFADLLSKVRKSVAQARNEKALSSTRAETSDDGRSYQSWRAPGSKQGPEKEKLTTSEVDDLLNRFHKAFSQKNESLGAAKENNTNRPYQAIPQQTNNNNNNQNYAYRTAQRKPVSFRIQPQVSSRHETPNEIPQRTIAKYTSDGNVPWWFDGSSDFMETPSVKKPAAVGNSFYDSNFLNGPLFDTPLMSGNSFSGPLLGDS